MKSLTKLTIAALMITIMIQSVSANNFNTFRLQISEDLIVDVTTKVESLVEENLPVIHNIIRKSNPLYGKRIILPVKPEESVIEDLATMPVSTYNTDELNLAAVVSKIRIPEEEIDDVTIDTQEVFEQYQAEHHFEISSKEISKFVKEEQEVTEDKNFYSLMKAISK